MTETSVDNPVRIFLSALSAIAIFSVMNIFVKLSAEDYSVPQIMFFRNLIAFFPILYMISRSGGVKLMRTYRPFAHIWRGVLGVFAMICFFTSFALLPLSNATAIHFASPLILTALSVFMLGEHVGPHRWTAVVIGLCAVIFMISPAIGGADMTGSLIALCAAFLGAMAMISVRKLGRTEHALTIAFYFTVCGTLGGGILMLFMWHPLHADTMFYLVMTGLCGGIAQIFMTNAYARAPAAYVASFAYLAMVFSVMSDVLIWGTWPDAHIWTGSAVIIASGLYILYRETLRKRPLSARTNLYGLQPLQPTEKDRKDPI